MTDVVIVDAIRTPVGALGGALASVRPDDMAALVIRETVQRNKLDPSLVEEVFFGCANQAGEDNRNVARMAALLAGLPVEVAGVTVNRLCASGLNAVSVCARKVFRFSISAYGLANDFWITSRFDPYSPPNDCLAPV
jgi:acetyl-CoA acetyltransferase